MPMFKATSIFVLALSLGSTAPARANDDQAQAVAEIEKMGGTVAVDEKSPGKPVIGVDFSDAKVTDVGLANLKGLTQLFGDRL